MKKLEIIELRHFRLLQFINYLDIGLHRLVVGVSRPTDDHFGRDAKAKGVDNECAPSAMGGHQRKLRIGLFNALVAQEINNLCRRVDAANFAKFLQVLIHALIRYDRENLVALVFLALVFVDDGL